MTNFVITSFASTKFVKVISAITNFVIKIMKFSKTDFAIANILFTNL